MTLKEEDTNKQNGEGAEDTANDQKSEGSNSSQDKGAEGAENSVDEKIESVLKKATEELGKSFESQLDSRIGKLTNTLYKKLGIKDEQKEGTAESESAETEKVDLDLRKTSVKAIARSEIKEALNYSDGEKEVIDSLIHYELSSIDLKSEEFSVESSAKAIQEKVVDLFTKYKKIFQDSKVDALRKAGQLKEIPQPGTQTNDKKSSEAYGAEIAKRRHQVNKE